MGKPAHLADANYTVTTSDPPAKQSLYLKAGAPTRCVAMGCGKQFAGFCIRGDDDRYYCSEVCAQIGFEIDVDRREELRLASSTKPETEKRQKIRLPS